MRPLLVLLGTIIAVALAAGPVVLTSSGQLQGVTSGSISKFLGAPT